MWPSLRPEMVSLTSDTHAHNQQLSLLTVNKQGNHAHLPHTRVIRWTPLAPLSECQSLLKARLIPTSRHHRIANPKPSSLLTVNKKGNYAHFRTVAYLLTAATSSQPRPILPCLFNVGCQGQVFLHGHGPNNHTHQPRDRKVRQEIQVGGRNCQAQGRVAPLALLLQRLLSRQHTSSTHWGEWNVLHQVSLHCNRHPLAARAARQSSCA